MHTCPSWATTHVRKRSRQIVLTALNIYRCYSSAPVDGLPLLSASGSWQSPSHPRLPFGQWWLRCGVDSCLSAIEGLGRRGTGKGHSQG